MNNYNLIDIRENETGEINGKIYKAEKADLYGAKMCLACDIHEPGMGCTNNKVMCYCPPRIFKEVEQTFNEEISDFDDYYDMKLKRQGCLPVLSILLSGAVVFWFMIYKLIIHIIHLLA